MKHLVLFPLLAAIALMSCKDRSGISHMEQMTVMKDSIFSAYPSVAGITINVQNGDLLVITLGSGKLAAASEAERRKIAGELGAMTLRLFGKDSGIEKEKLIITPNEHNTEAEPADGLVTHFNIDSLEDATFH